MARRLIRPALALAFVLAAAPYLLATGAAARRRSSPPDAAERAAQVASPTTFALRWGNVSSPHAVVSTTVLPRETVAFAAVAPDGSVLESEVDAAPGLERDGARGWRYTPLQAPAMQVFTVRVHGAEQPATFQVFVAVPRAEVRDGRLNDFVLGDYPAAAEIQGAQIEPPRGFIEVTPENAGTLVSPHFALGQFVCKQSGDFPKYLVLDDRLPLKLEGLLARVRAAGIAASTLTVMSGFRTPHYNHGLGNVPYSKHLWGAAADVYVDESPRDGTMDDLDGDGRVDRRDAEFLAALAESLEASPEGERLVGGIGHYAATDAHGPFVHVDVRQRSARW